MRLILAVLLLGACSKSQTEPRREPTQSAPRDAASLAAQAFAIRRDVTTSDDTEEAWLREIGDPRARSVQGVRAVKWRGDWRVTVSVMEFIRDVPLEAVLRKRIMAALRAVPGVAEVSEEDREVWSIVGEPSGMALVEAVAPIVDEVAVESRKEIDR